MCPKLKAQFPSLKLRVIAIVILALFAALVYVLKKTTVSHLVANTVAAILCVLFLFDFLPALLSEVMGKMALEECKA